MLSASVLLTQHPWLSHPQLVSKFARHPRAFLDAFAAAYLKMASMNAVWQPYK